MTISPSSVQPRFFNSLSRKLENFTPQNANLVKLYVCGPTVYDRPHLGNVRSIMVYDLLFRFLKQIYPQVLYVRNITDVDDKINAAAKEQKISIQELTKKITELFHQDISALNALPPTVEPKATENIAEMIKIIELLIAKNHAYVSQNHVLFDVGSYANYGKLSNRQTEEMISGARIEIADYKKNPLDFVLWKPSDAEDDISSIFDSPWGKGRPGWHIECSAMSSKFLGVDFDIHGGGADLQFPHHENEIAQSCCAFENSSYARYWIHNGFLTVNGEKMSKSLKNFITLHDLLQKGENGVVIRLMLLSTHYRKPFDFNAKALEDAQKTLEKFYAVIDFENPQELLAEKIQNNLLNQVLQHLADDLNISKTLASLHDFVKKVKETNSRELKVELLQTLDFLGLVDFEMLQKKFAASENSSTEFADSSFVEQQIAARIQAKKDKNYALADKIRADLLAMNIVLEDVAADKTLWKKQ